MPDKIFEGFLDRQFQEGRILADESDLLSLESLDRQHHRAEFRCHGLVQQAPGQIVTGDRFRVGIWFPASYLRVADPVQVLTWLGPRNVWHPNISRLAPVICIGRLQPGTPLVHILYQLFEVITWNKVTVREDDALNIEACQWARRNGDRFPVDRRPLKRAKES
jgi:hypothetical protein